MKKKNFLETIPPIGNGQKEKKSENNKEKEDLYKKEEKVKMGYSQAILEVGGFLLFIVKGNDFLNDKEKEEAMGKIREKINECDLGQLNKFISGAGLEEKELEEINQIIGKIRSKT